MRFGYNIGSFKNYDLVELIIWAAATITITETGYST